MALVLCTYNLHAQDFLIRQFPALDTIEKTQGPNLKNYNAGIFGFGLLFGPTDSAGSNVNVQRSFWLTYGGRYKRKRGNLIHTGSDFYFDIRNFNIAQTNDKVFGGAVQHKKERFFQFSLNLAPFIRFNLSKRGNHLGKYIDVYADAAWSFMNRHYVIDDINPINGAKQMRQTFSKLQYVNHFYGQVGLRYGISFFQFQAFYRPFNMFKKSSQYPFPELPRFGLGILIDFEQDND